ncbi:phosphate ABC transporter permease PstA [Acetobacteraceae bacterium]|nr:phosphate ABC transporter permease PstA [Acetobacteraceae bacterium]
MSEQKILPAKEAKLSVSWEGGKRASRRRWKDRFATVFAYGMGIILLACVISIFWNLLAQGLPGLKAITFTHAQGAPGSSGGLGNAIVGSLIQTGLGMLIAGPLGLFCGIYLAAYGGPKNHFATSVRFVSDMLMSVPSILAGLFIYQLLVAPFAHFSAFAGSVSLAVLSMPLVIRSTEDMLSLVPAGMREAAYALGAPRWKVIWTIWVRAARGGIVTGMLLALARMGGETAPLLFTSMGNPNWSFDLNKPMASLPVAIYQYAGSSYSDWVGLAWTGALLVTLGVLGINLIVRGLAHGLQGRK